MLEGMRGAMERMNEIQERIGSLASRPASVSSPSRSAESPAGDLTASDFRSRVEAELRARARASAPEKAAPVAGSEGSPYADEIAAASRRERLPASLLEAVIERESNFNPRAVSDKGARGLMQLMPDTARELGVQDAFDPAANIAGGAKYLRGLLDRYDGDLARALSAYNAGPEAVKDRSVPPYAETRDYVKRVVDSYLRRSGAAPSDHAI